MAGATLLNLTIITNFLCLAISLWFAIYLLARGLANPLTFRAVVALFSLAFFFNSSLPEIGISTSNSGAIRSLSTLIALIAVHDLTHYLLPLEFRRKFYWMARAIVLIGILAILLLFSVPPEGICPPNYICPSSLGYPWVFVDGIKIFIVGTTLYNLYMVVKTQDQYHSFALYGAILLGFSTVLYSFISTIFQLQFPRFIPNVLVLFALFLLLYSVAQDQILSTRRRSSFEIPVTLLTTTVIAGIYAGFALRIGLSSTSILLLLVLAIFSHSAYDLMRELLNRALRKQEHDTRQELRQLSHLVSSDQSLPDALQSGLSILCNTLHIPNGWIAIRQGEQYQVAASIHALPTGSAISAEHIDLEDIHPQIYYVHGDTYWLIPADIGLDCVAVIGIGARKVNGPFHEEDLFWMEDIVEEIAHMISTHRVKNYMMDGEAAELGLKDTIGGIEELEPNNLLSALSFKPDPGSVKLIEEGFRFLNDYSTLGNSPLVLLMGIKSQDHIEAGKLVHQKLTDVLEKLRPQGEPPSEPLPREWHAYTILHDAYVEEKLARDIMAKLFISEGTYFRMRRHALRGVTKALLEGAKTA